MLVDQEKPLKEYYTMLNPYGADKQESVVGIELENEILPENLCKNLNENGFPNYVHNWKFHSEGSLRHVGFEFVSKPLRKGSIANSITGFFSKLRSAFESDKLKFTNSLRTSVHVHVEVLHMNTLEIVNFATLYWLMEPFLQHFCGSHRQGNLFCIRLKDSAWMKMQLASMLKKGKSINGQNFCSETYRYSSVNFASMAKFGTIEFRMMRGVSHERPMLLWVETLLKLKDFALQFTNPLELRDWFLNKVDAKDVPKVIFGEVLADKLTNYIPEDSALTTEDLVREGYLSVLQIFTAQNEYGEDRKKKEEAERREQLAQLSQASPMLHYVNSTQIPHPASNPAIQEHLFVGNDFVSEIWEEAQSELLSETQEPM